MQESAIDVPPFLCGRGDLVLGNEDKFLRLRPALEEVLEGFPDHGFAVSTAHLPEVLKLV